MAFFSLALKVVKMLSLVMTPRLILFNECMLPSFRPDEELLQIETSVVLSVGVGEVKDLSGGEHNFHSQDIATEETLLHNVETASVGRDVTANHAGTSRSQIPRHFTVELFQVFVGVL